MAATAGPRLGGSISSNRVSRPEMAFLRNDVYGWSAQIRICELNALNRYSDRLH